MIWASRQHRKASDRLDYTKECVSMLPNVWHNIKRCTGGAMVLLALAVPAAAQQPALQPSVAQSSVAQTPADQRLDRLEKQNEEFRKQVEILIQQNQALHAKMNSVPAIPTAAPGGAAISRDEVKELVENYLAQVQPKQDEGAPKAE